MRIKDEQALMVVARLSQNTDFDVFMQLVRTEYQDALDMCVSEDKPARYQGKAEILGDLIKTVDGARETYRERTAHTTDMSQSL